MEQLEIAILIVVLLLLLLSVVSMIIYWRKDRRHGYHYGGLSHPANCKCPSCIQGFESLDMDRAALISGSWQDTIQEVGVDPATKFSHKEYKDELLSKTTGSSPWTLMDHDIDSNWLGLGWGKTYKKVYAQEGARVSESVDWQDMPSHPGLRWRCHEYVDSDEDNSGVSCPWPPVSDQKFS